MDNLETEKRGVRKERKGIVAGKSGNKSIVVLVERRRQHPFYGKVIKSSKKYHTHDEKNEAMVGDFVRIVEARPLSRIKRWRLVEILKRTKKEIIVDEGLLGEEASGVNLKERE